MFKMFPTFGLVQATQSCVYYQGRSQPHSPGWARVPLSLFFLKSRSIFFIFPQTLIIFILIWTLRVGDSPTWEGTGYATVYYIIRFAFTRIFAHLVLFICLYIQELLWVYLFKSDDSLWVVLTLWAYCHNVKDALRYKGMHRGMHISLSFFLCSQRFHRQYPNNVDLSTTNKQNYPHNIILC